MDNWFEGGFVYDKRNLSGGPLHIVFKFNPLIIECERSHKNRTFQVGSKVWDLKVQDQSYRRILDPRKARFDGE